MRSPTTGGRRRPTVGVEAVPEEVLLAAAGADRAERPVSLTVKGGAINRVYAVGDPEKKTMNVAVHVLTVGTIGSKKPSEVNTGTGGQAVAAGPSLEVNLAR